MKARRFFLLIEQTGGGCDYTIGCGLRLVELKRATDMVSAESEAADECEGIEDLAKATIYEVVSIASIDIACLKSKWAERKAIAQAAAKELEERALLAKLQKKYPNS